MHEHDFVFTVRIESQSLLKTLKSSQSIKSGLMLLFKTCGGKYSVLAILPVEADDPCEPNPCGSYSTPPVRRDSRCDCSCLPGMVGSPPNCRPECLRNTDCPTDKACKNQKCIDPCPGLCGRNANCNVRNHIPYCICQTGYIGDPFTSCQKPSKSSGTRVEMYEIFPSLQLRGQ